jgi:uracil-DNA glycosylase family 4
MTAVPHADPSPGCPLCPRLVAFRHEMRDKHEDWFNAPVPSFGDLDAQFLVVGLAPGMKGANRTGRPFTGDYAGVLLYETLIEAGFAIGHYDQRPDDGLQLRNCLITNAVRCLPPANKPETGEIATCRPFLIRQIEALPHLKVILALGRIAHDSTLAAFGLKKSALPFGHGARHALPGGRVLIDSYHCSRYNTQTRRLTPEMFRNVIMAAKAELD